MLQNRAKDALLIAVFNVVLVVVDITRHLELWVTIMNAATVVVSLIMYFVLRHKKPVRTWEEERRDVLVLIEREHNVSTNQAVLEVLQFLKVHVKTGSHDMSRR